MSDSTRQEDQIIQLELRLDKLETPAFKMLINALLSAAREELAWEAEGETREASGS